MTVSFGGEDYLEVRDLVVDFDGFKAIGGVDVTLLQGRLHFLIGPNGAGKTTLVDALTGLVRGTGEAMFRNHNLLDMKSHKIVRLGIGRTFQTLQVFGGLSVRDNLIVAAQEFQGTMRQRLFARPDAGLGEQADRMIELFRLQPVAKLKAGTLSYGQQKLIDIAMAFMPQPRLVLLDEPCAGVNPSLVDQLRELLVELNRSQGGSFVVIEHNMDFVMRLCPHVICMVEGKVLAEGAPAEVQANRAVLEAYLGN